MTSNQQIFKENIDTVFNKAKTTIPKNWINIIKLIGNVMADNMELTERENHKDINYILNGAKAILDKLEKKQITTLDKLKEEFDKFAKEKAYPLQISLPLQFLKYINDNFQNGQMFTWINFNTDPNYCGGVTEETLIAIKQIWEKAKEFLKT